jgi:hypothetical protein
MLRAMLAAKQEQLLSRDHEIEHLELVIAKLRRILFGATPERVAREIEQLELRMEELETKRTSTSSPRITPPSPTEPSS